jgi:Raf kinase inhibitor-like YbhB/YbcL family protein
MTRVASLYVVLALFVALSLAGCGSTAAPEPGAPTSTPSEPPAVPSTPAPPPSEPTPAPSVEETPASASTPAPPMEMSSTAFEDEGEIPPRHALCPDQENLSPPIDWTNVPPGTESLSLVCVDSAVAFVHWAIYNIPPTAAGLAEGVPPLGELEDGSLQGFNDYGEDGYIGPCPPTGETHEYVFTLYALDAMLDLPAGATADSVLRAAVGHILAQAQVSGSYVWQ